MRKMLLVLCLSQIAACAVWQGQRVPNLVATTAEPAVEPVPAMKVVLGHRHTMDNDRRDSFEGLSGQQFQKSYDRVAPLSPIMRQASTGPIEPVNYVLFLDTAVNEHGQAMAILSGLTLMLFPVVTHSDIVVTASLYEAASGKEVGVYEAKGKLNVMMWLPLLPITPVNLLFSSGKALYDDTFADVFIQLAASLQGKPLPEAIDPSRLEIERVPTHEKREIRVL